MISDSEVFTHHSHNSQHLTSTSPIKESLCDPVLLSAKTFDVSPTTLDGAFPYLQSNLSVNWNANNPTNPTNLCYPSAMQVMYGMLPYWMVTPAMTNPNLLRSSVTTPSTPTSAISPGVTSRPHTEPLYDWIKAHEKDPYPTRREKEILGRVCGMTARQIEHWFANARRRMKKMQNSKRLRGSTDSTMEREDDAATLTSSFSSASSTEDSLLTPTTSSSLINTSLPDKHDERTDIKKPKGIWSIISTLQ